MEIKTFAPSYPLKDSWLVTPPCEYPNDESYCHYLCPYADDCGVDNPFDVDDDNDEDWLDGFVAH